MMGNKKTLLTAIIIIVVVVVITQNPGATQFSDLVITASTPLTRGALATELGRERESEWLASSEPSPSTWNPWDILHQ
jgi:hypothetical protein